MDTQFYSAISYSLKCLRSPELTLKTEQRVSVKHIYDGRGVFVWQPTGFGKSLCYKFLPFLYDRRLDRDDSLVVLVSLMVEILRKKG